MPIPTRATLTCDRRSTRTPCWSRAILTTWWWRTEVWVTTACHPSSPLRARLYTAEWTPWAAIYRTSMLDNRRGKVYIDITPPSSQTASIMRERRKTQTGKRQRKPSLVSFFHLRTSRRITHSDDNTVTSSCWQNAMTDHIFIVQRPDCNTKPCTSSPPRNQRTNLKKLDCPSATRIRNLQESWLAGASKNFTDEQWSLSRVTLGGRKSCKRVHADYARKQNCAHETLRKTVSTVEHQTKCVWVWMWGGVSGNYPGKTREGDRHKRDELNGR